MGRTGRLRGSGRPTGNAAAQTGAMAMSSCLRNAVCSEASTTLPETDMSGWELTTFRRSCSLAATRWRSVLRDDPVEYLRSWHVGVGSVAHAGVERVDAGQLLGGQVEVEHVEVLGDAGRVGRLRDG